MILEAYRPQSATGRNEQRVVIVGTTGAGKAVLIHTGWSRHRHTDVYLEGRTFLTGDAAELLRERGTALVGIDS